VSFLNNNMSFKYNIHIINTRFIHIFYEIEYDDYTIKIEYSYSLKLALYICTLPFILIFLLKTHLDLLGFILSGGSTKFQTWLVRKVHSFKLFLGINIIYYFQVINNLISYEQHVIHSFHERSFSR
jgi:hypothetical protein